MADSHDGVELLRQGIAAARAGRNEEARALLLGLVGQDEHNEQAWLWLSAVVDTDEDRRTCLENILAINPNHALAQAGLRHLATSAVPPPAVESSTALPEVVSSDRCPYCGAQCPPSGQFCHECGQPLIVACPACGRYAEVDKTACPNCGQALGDYQEGIAYYLSLAEAYIAHGKRELAARTLEHAAQRAVGNVESLGQVAAVWEKIPNLERAATALEEAVALAPKNGVLYARLAAVYKKRCMPAESRAAYEKAATTSKDPTVLLALARLLVDDKETLPKSFELLNRVVKIQPNNPEVHLLLADAYRAQFNVPQAYNHYQRACQYSAPDSPIGIEARSRLIDFQTAVSGSARGREGGEALAARAQERPGCLSLFAILMAVDGLFSLLGSIALLALGTQFLGQIAPLAALPVEASLVQPLFLGAAAASFGYGLFNLLLAYGLWNMRNWARVIVIVLQVLSLVGILCQAAASVGLLARLVPGYEIPELMKLPAIALIGPLVGMVISVYIIFWFIANRDQFS